MGSILTCCGSSSCGWRKQKVASCDESDVYEAVAATTSESATVEPGKLDVAATEGQDLQHISNKKMPTGSVPDLEDCALDIVDKMLPEMVNYTAQNSYRPPEDRLSLKFLPPSEEDNDDAQILPSRVQASPEDNLSLVCLPGNEDYDGDDDDDDDVQVLPSPVQASPEDNLSLICLARSEDDDCDDADHDNAQILPSPIQDWPEDRLFLRCLPRYKDEDDDDDVDAHITAQKESDLTLESLSDEEIHPAQ
ncbi:aspartate-rich protein 1-like isoform X2 [Hylobates moloch]|uniref:aspartate-rich protein 1-like isoform X2 n=1 Tax=Hylobates moloch TaxID=81572 RepID=UPI0026752DAC|nr:aspartate-rich protein 1-like isoform X2 [Hylobates moloch]